MRMWSALADFFIRWWREAAGPINWYNFQTPFRAVFRRVMLWVPVVVLTVLVFGGLGLHFFLGWRARDLARKAVVNVESKNLNMARVQITSARNLRPDDPEVLRALATIETRLGAAGAVRSWQKLPADLALTPEELELRATAMMRGGDGAQFQEALAALENAGRGPQAGMLRAEHLASRGNLQQAIVEARAAVAGSDLPAKRLALLRLLLVRHARYLQGASGTAAAQDLAAGREISGLVDSLQGAPEGEEATALALGLLRPSHDDVRRWCDAAWKRPAPGNPALLPAAAAMVASGQATREEMIDRLKAVYADADPARKAALAGWLLAQGDAEGALVYAPPDEAARNAQAFFARTAALAALGRWDDLLAVAEGAGTVPRSLMLATAVQANARLGRAGRARKGAQDAVRAAAREGTAVMTLRILDEAGFREAADEEVIALCGEPETSERMFVLARDRFGRRGQRASLRSAYKRAYAASPNSQAVADYRRYRKMISGTAVDPQITAAALAANPIDLNLRMTHALALLKAGKPKDAMAVFDDFDVFVEELPPGYQALAAVILAANGESGQARSLVLSINPDLLAEGEFALLLGIK